MGNITGLRCLKPPLSTKCERNCVLKHPDIRSLRGRSGQPLLLGSLGTIPHQQSSDTNLLFPYDLYASIVTNSVSKLMDDSCLPG